MEMHLFKQSFRYCLCIVRLNALVKKRTNDTMMYTRQAAYNKSPMEKEIQPNKILRKREITG